MYRSLTYICGPTHSWLSVSLEDLRRLGIVDEISSSSRMSATRAYLEEDRDAPIFIRAAERAGWGLSFKESYPNRTYIWSLGSYKPYFVHFPPRIGDPVRIFGSTHTFVVVDIHPKHGYILQRQDGQGLRYRAPKSNPFAYIRPPEDETQGLSQAS